LLRIVIIVEVTDGSFVAWIEQEVARGSVELEAGARFTI
jgi:hypothetical protein